MARALSRLMDWLIGIWQAMARYINRMRNNRQSATREAYRGSIMYLCSGTPPAELGIPLVDAILSRHPITPTYGDVVDGVLTFSAEHIAVDPSAANAGTPTYAIFIKSGVAVGRHRIPTDMSLTINGSTVLTIAKGQAVTIGSLRIIEGNDPGIGGYTPPPGPGPGPAPAPAWSIAVSGGGLVDGNDDPILLRGVNVYGVMPYDVASGANATWGTGPGQLNEETKWQSRLDVLTDMATRLGNQFNMASIPISPLVFDPAYPGQKAQLTALADRLQTLGKWLIIRPYGMWKYGDIVSRDNRADANETGTLDETNAAAITVEVQACHDAIVDWMGSRPNVLICLLNEPRAQSDATWKAQNLAWIANLRAANYQRPIFICGTNWATNLPVQATADLVAADDQLVFLVHYYEDSGHPGEPRPDGTGQAANTALWPGVLTSRTNGIAVGIGEIGARINSDLVYPAARQRAWFDAVLTNWVDAPMICPWMWGPHDQNAMVGDWTKGVYDSITSQVLPVFNPMGMHIANRVFGVAVTTTIPPSTPVPAPGPPPAASTVLLNATFDSGNLFGFTPVNAKAMTIVNGRLHVENSAENSYGSAVRSFVVPVESKIRVSADLFAINTYSQPTIHIANADWTAVYAQNRTVFPMEFIAQTEDFTIWLNTDSIHINDAHEFDNIKVENITQSITVTVPPPTVQAGDRLVSILSDLDSATTTFTVKAVDDYALFEIVSTNRLRFIDPAVAGSYDVTVTGTNGGTTADLAIAVTVV